MAVLSKKKKEIYTRAAELFRDKGYRASSMRELAERVGLEPSSLYSHIRSKEEILRSICFEVAATFTEGMAEIRSSGYDPLRQLEDVIRLHIDVALEDRTALTVFSDEWRNLSPDHQKEFLHLRRQYEDNLWEIIHDGVRSGQLKPVEEEILLNTLLSALRWIYYRAESLQMKNSKDLAKQLADLLLYGFCHQA